MGKKIEKEKNEIVEEFFIRLKWKQKKELFKLNTRHFFIEPFLYSSNIISYLKIKLQKNNLFVKIST